MDNIDLISDIDSGGCSSKLPPDLLKSILSKLPQINHPNLIVGSSTQDDAAVYKINNETALIFTVDFFPPVCSNPYHFGQIAAANSLSDIYAMGGKPIIALNLIMIPGNDFAEDVYLDILNGGYDKLKQAGVLPVGGHTINDNYLKFGMAVVGTTHPDRIISNNKAKPGDILILTKPLGTGIAISAYKNNLGDKSIYYKTIDLMSLLNDKAADIMQRNDVKAATDITGFGFCGHTINIARESRVSIKIDAAILPVINGVEELADIGCLPAAAFSNMKYVSDYVIFRKSVSYNKKMLLCDAQTSGGILMAVANERSGKVLSELKKYYASAEIVGEVIPQTNNLLIIE